MFDRLKRAFFPCDRVVKQIIAEREIAVEKNKAAHEKLLSVCGDFCDIKKPDIFRDFMPHHFR